MNALLVFDLAPWATYISWRINARQAQIIKWYEELLSLVEDRDYEEVVAKSKELCQKLGRASFKPRKVKADLYRTQSRAYERLGKYSYSNEMYKKLLDVNPYRQRAHLIIPTGAWDINPRGAHS